MDTSQPVVIKIDEQFRKAAALSHGSEIRAETRPQGRAEEMEVGSFPSFLLATARKGEVGPDREDGRVLLRPLKHASCFSAELEVSALEGSMTAPPCCSVTCSCPG